jgi:IclR family transcriptional regulator, KDG regulon repressor
LSGEAATEPKKKRNPSMGVDKYSVPAVGRMNEILMLLVRRGDRLTISEIAQTTGIAKTTCLRLLSSLTQYGFLSFHPNEGSYGLGAKLIVLGKKAESTLSWMDDLKSMLGDFALAIQETVKVSVLQNDHVSVLLRAESPQPLRISLSSGSTFPIHTGAASKMLLAQLSEEDANSILPESLESFTKNTITDKQSLLAHVARIREAGYAVDHEEYVSGVFAVAVPITLPGRLAAVSVTFLRPEDLETTIQSLLPKLRNFVDHARSMLANYS